MPRRRRKNSNNQKLEVTGEEKQVKEEQNVSVEEKSVQVTKQSVEQKHEQMKEEVQDPVIDHLKNIGALYAEYVTDDELNSPMAYYIAIIVPKGKKNASPVPAIVKANRKTGYVRSMIPITPRAFVEIEKKFRDAIVKCEQLKSEAERRKKEIELKQMLSKLSKEDIELLRQMLSQVK